MLYPLYDREKMFTYTAEGSVVFNDSQLIGFDNFCIYRRHRVDETLCCDWFPTGSYSAEISQAV